jgi:hypothetical protein
MASDVSRRRAVAAGGVLTAAAPAMLLTDRKRLPPPRCPAPHAAVMAGWDGDETTTAAR